MSRKNNRATGYQPLDLTPEDVPQPFRTPAERADQQRRARAMQGIDWSLCIVPGCGDRLVTMTGRQKFGPERRDPTLELPICFTHSAILWTRLAKFQTDNPEFIEAIADVNARLAARERREHDQRQTAHLARQDGDMYFIKLNGMVKVGWTRDLRQRVKSYGASAELLVSYPATRDDETNLHRQLRPALAKGREWYEDGDIIRGFIAEALSKYGPPDLEVAWTTPKRIVAGKRHR